MSRPLKPELADNLNPGSKKGKMVKMPDEKFVKGWYNLTIVSLFIKEITDEQEK